MTNAKNKNTAISVIIVLMLASSAVMITMPIGNALTNLSVTTGYDHFIGQNSATKIIWYFNPNIFATDPNYIGRASMWSNAVVTFTRPDGTKDVVNGPFNTLISNVQGFNSQMYLIYTPDTQGLWNVTLYRPADSTYNAINTTTMMYVGPHHALRETWAMLSIKPAAVVGLGQDVLINAWVTPPPMTNHQIFEGYMFTFTGPSSSFTVGPMNSETPGTVWFNVPLTELGNWTIKFDYPGSYIDLPATITKTITVQQEPVPEGYPDTPLPTEPWSFPINVENREWRTIAGPWYQSNYNASAGSMNPYTEGVKTAHVLWMLPSTGQIGGFIGSPHSIQTGGGFEGYPDTGDAGIYTTSVPSINTIMAGRGYYNSGGMIHCLDMFTGEELWAVTGAFDVGTREGRSAYLYDFQATRFIKYDAITGAMTTNVTGINYNYYDDINNVAYSYQQISPIGPTINGFTDEFGFIIKWSTAGTSNNFASRIIWNVTNPLPSMGTSYGPLIDNVWTGRRLQGASNTGSYTSNSMLIDYAIGVNMTTGKVEWNTTLSNPADPTTWVYHHAPASGSGEGLYYFAAHPYKNPDVGWLAIDATTGRVAWWGAAADYPWGDAWAYMPVGSGYGMVFGLGYNGVYAFNATNGDRIWHYIDQDIYNEEPYGGNVAPNGTVYEAYAFGSTGPVLGGGIIYAPNSEHSPTFIYRGEGLLAIDAFTGQLYWKIVGQWSPSAIAYGILLASDSYNGYSYAFGKGNTETTVSPSSEVIAKGNSILLKGSVLDMSPAQKGTAAIADKSQTAWMEYLHMQQPFPLNATGVEVSLDALDPNNNFVHIGNATSDTTGKYSFGWQPEIEGKYTIIASFYSTEAYYGSQAETAMYVGAAPATPVEQPQQAATDNTPILYAVIGIGIALLIAIAVATLLIIRKRA